MNYLGLGSMHPEALAGLTDDEKFIWDVENMKAALPLNPEGKSPRTILTDLRDVAKFVSAACDLPDGQWEQDMGMAGDKKHVDDVVTIIEKVRGAKMGVTYRPIEQISKEAKEEKDIMRKFWLQLEEACARDVDG